MKFNLISNCKLKIWCYVTVPNPNMPDAKVPNVKVPNSNMLNAKVPTQHIIIFSNIPCYLVMFPLVG
jgi:hypothetical protein